MILRGLIDAKESACRKLERRSAVECVKMLPSGTSNGFLTVDSAQTLSIGPDGGPWFRLDLTIGKEKDMVSARVQARQNESSTADYWGNLG